jgi:hypothetical protein
VPLPPTSRSKPEHYQLPVRSFGYGHHGTRAWRVEYAKRNGVESFNSQLKKQHREALDSPGRRQVRGRTAAFVFTTMIVVAENLRLIDNLVANEARAAAPTPRTKRRTRGTPERAPATVAIPLPLHRSQPAGVSPNVDLLEETRAAPAVGRWLDR